jgi:hypothetical protein
MLLLPVMEKAYAAPHLTLFHSFSILGQQRTVLKRQGGKIVNVLNIKKVGHEGFVLTFSLFSRKIEAENCGRLRRLLPLCEDLTSIHMTQINFRQLFGILFTMFMLILVLIFAIIAITEKLSIIAASILIILTYYVSRAVSLIIYKQIML